MKFKSIQGLISASIAIMLLSGPVHADALLGVIGYHIVPMQIENEDSQEGQQEEESDDDTSDSDQTTVAFEAVKQADRKLVIPASRQVSSAHSS